MIGQASPSVLFVGCGDIAQRLAVLLHNDYRLTGLRRHPNSLPDFIAPLAADVCDGVAVRAALQHIMFDYVVITLTPGERSEARYRQVYVDGTRHVLTALQGKPRLLFVSSTSVYAQDSGEVVNEQSPALGKGFSGRCLLEAEQQVAVSRFAATVVRFSGIYGAGRSRLLQQVREGRVDIAQAGQWTNRIHTDDAARVLEHLIRRWQAGISPSPCYIASDTFPVSAGEVWRWLAIQQGVPDPLAKVDQQRAEATGKQCSSALLQQTGFQFLYPDFRVGYADIFSKTVKL